MTPFRIDRWWDGSRGCYRCNLRLESSKGHGVTLIEVATMDGSVYGSPVSAELLAWKEMAERLARQVGEFQPPVSPPMSFDLSH